MIQEAENDVALKISGLDNKNTQEGQEIIVSGRGDLHLGIFLEKMRREGFEMEVSPP